MSDDRFDDWASTTAGLGSVRDKSAGIYFDRRESLQAAQLEALYEQNPIVAKIVDRLSDDAFRHGWTLEGVEFEDGSAVDVPAIMEILSEFQINEALSQASRWSRLYGGAAVLLPVYDGRPPEEPLNARTASTIFPLRTLAAPDVLPMEMDADLVSPTYLKVLKYQIHGILSQPTVVHHSRLIPFEPIKLPPTALMRNQRRTAFGWGPSIIDRIFDDLSYDGSAAKHAIAMMYVSSILHIGINGFANKHSTKDGKQQLEKLFRDMRRNLDSLGILGMDAADTIGNLTLSVAGADSLIDRMRARLAAAGNMPKEILFNESPAGLNAGELSGPQEIWFAQVEAEQEKVFTPAIDRILGVIFPILAKTGRLPAIKSWKVEWQPLWTRSDDAEATTLASLANSDNIYLTQGVVTPDEVRDFRFVQGRKGPIELPQMGGEPPLDLSAEVSATEQAAALPADTSSTQDIALNGAQFEALKNIAISVNTGELSYEQGIGIIEAGFPSLRGKAGAVLGPKVLKLPAESSPGAEVAAPSQDAIPDDVMSPRDAAAKLGLPTRAITKLIDAGSLRYWGIGSHKRISFADIAKLARAHEAVAVGDPVGEYPDFDSCVLAQIEQGHDEESARRICGKIEQQTRGADTPDV